MQTKVSLAILSSVFLLAACSSSVSQPQGNTDTLQNLQNLGAPAPTVQPTSGTVTDMREDALQVTAMTVGAQSGLHWRSEQINQTLMQQSKQLDQIYDFNKILLDDNVLPPVLTEARQTLNLDGPNTIRLADQTYEIVSQAKFVTTAPTWRDYLWMSYPQPPIPNSGILPHNAAEQKVWQTLATQGWNEGVSQANEIYSENLSRLERDYKGMLLYRNLRAQNIVSAPFIAMTNLGVTGGGSDLNVNDQVLRITALPALQPNSQRWRPALITEPTEPQS